jgi:hypothetical protein
LTYLNGAEAGTEPPMPGKRERAVLDARPV